MPMVGRDKFAVFFDYTDSNGDYNGIPAGTVLTQAWLEAKLNNVDPTVRWYIAPEMFNIAAPAPEAETVDRDGIPVPTGEETKQPITYEHSKEEANPALKAFYDSIKCRDLGVIFITKSGQLNGMNDGTGDLIGIHIQLGTLSAQYAAPVKGQLQTMMVSYLVDELENDANRDFIGSESISYATKNWFASQPLEVIPLHVSNSGTITFTLDGLYGGVDRKKPIEGFVSADFSIDDGVTTSEAYNQTTASTVTFTVAESGTIPGQYVGTLGTIASPGDIIQIGIFKSGYNMRDLLVTMVAS
jgi:hypothetical protein